MISKSVKEQTILVAVDTLLFSVATTPSTELRRSPTKDISILLVKRTRPHLQVAESAGWFCAQ
ncbi:hypothetical protein IPF89_04145 [Candidatus Saccharibacteria bacterium]|nr:MAG: hypothetical protein IPF89_04145 [Candidatus Saccharibacteria bacterium]